MPLDLAGTIELRTARVGARIETNAFLDGQRVPLDAEALEAVVILISGRPLSAAQAYLLHALGVLREAIVATEEPRWIGGGASPIETVVPVPTPASIVAPVEPRSVEPPSEQALAQARQWHAFFQALPGGLRVVERDGLERASRTCASALLAVLVAADRAAVPGAAWDAIAAAYHARVMGDGSR